MLLFSDYFMRNLNLVHFFFCIDFVTLHALCMFFCIVFFNIILLQNLQWGCSSAHSFVLVVFMLGSWMTWPCQYRVALLARVVLWEVIPGTGFVSEVFDESKLNKLPGSAANCHIQYATAGASVLKSVQPNVAGYRFRSLAMAHGIWWWPMEFGAVNRLCSWHL